MQSLRTAVRDLVDRSIEIGGDSGHGTVVIDAGPGLVQWLAESRGVFQLEVADPADTAPRRRWSPVRRREPPAGFTERDIALLTGLGFVPTDPHYPLRPVDAALDREHTVHIITTVLHDLFGVRDPDGLSADIF